MLSARRHSRARHARALSLDTAQFEMLLQGGLSLNWVLPVYTCSASSTMLAQLTCFEIASTAESRLIIPQDTFSDS